MLRCSSKRLSKRLRSLGSDSPPPLDELRIRAATTITGAIIHEADTDWPDRADLYQTGKPSRSKAMRMKLPQGSRPPGQFILNSCLLRDLGDLAICDPLDQPYPSDPYPLTQDAGPIADGGRAR
jgi:hypothetical protein